jgi:colanic acid biosynthesis glycosyl transferase WcaI
MANARMRRVPWVLWLQDILPDGAVATGLMDDGRLIRTLRRVESAAYRSARRIVVISDSFAANLAAKGVPSDKVVRIYNPATLPIQREAVGSRRVDERLVLTMGNIGHTQNLVHVAAAFESSAALAGLGARFVMAGDGVAGDDVRAAIRSDRVQVTGVLEQRRVEDYLGRAAVAVVSQQYAGVDFNVPSKLMNFMGYGLPTLAAVRGDSEVARIVSTSGGGWVAPGEDRGSFAATLARALRDGEDRRRRGALALAFARENFAPASIAEKFESVLLDVVAEPVRTRWRVAAA